MNFLHAIIISKSGWTCKSVILPFPTASNSLVISLLLSATIFILFPQNLLTRFVEFGLTKFHIVTLVRSFCTQFVVILSRRHLPELSAASVVVNASLSLCVHSTSKSPWQTIVQKSLHGVWVKLLQSCCKYLPMNSANYLR